MRHFDLETNLSMLKGCREFLGAGVCAADLAGDETSWPMNQFRGIVPRGRRSWIIRIPFMQGECGNVQNIIDAVDAGAAVWDMEFP